VRPSDIFTAAGTGAIAQFRILGGVIGLAIATCVSTPYIRDSLLETISPEQTSAVLEKLETIPSLPEAMQIHVRYSFRRGFDLQMTVLIGFAAAHIPAGLLMLSREILPKVLRLQIDPEITNGN
jgi:hypothetical protein